MGDGVAVRLVTVTGDIAHLKYIMRGPVGTLLSIIATCTLFSVVLIGQSGRGGASSADATSWARVASLAQ